MRARRLVVLALAALSLAAQEPLGPAKDDVNSYSLEKEAALGKQLAAEFRRQSIVIGSPTIQGYVDRLGRRLAAQMPDAKLPFTFSVIADDHCRAIHEPAALPGGYVFVPAALFLAARDEEEFAGMLAHAMQHVALRHGSRPATRGTIVGYASIPLIFTGGWGGGCSGGQTVPVGFMASQRSAELEADSSAVAAMARAGYDPRALVRYIERVQVRPGETVSKTNSPLPNPDQRLAIIRSAIDNLPPIGYPATPPGEFAAAQQEVRRLAAPPRVPSRTPPSLRRKTPE